MMISDKIKKIDKVLEGGLSSGKVTMIAVTKYASDEQVIEAYQAGLKIFAENYVKPALERQLRLQSQLGDEVEWHLIGPLQSNKVTKAVGNFTVIQSVHSYKLASKIDQRARELGIRQKIFLQVNTTGDKNGFEPEELKLEYPKLQKLDSLEILGLMTMGFYESSKNSETIFRQMRQLREVVGFHHPAGRLALSMGMTGDYHIAAKFSSDYIRIGRALFGDRE